MSWYAGIDLGATNIRAVVGDKRASIEGKDCRSTPRRSGIDVTEAILAALRAACNDAGIKPAGLTAVGIGTFGPLDGTEGVVRNPANLPDRVETIPLTGPLEELANAPVYLHNDANAGVIGERFYADTAVDNMVYLTISSGIGAGVVVDGKLLSGWDGNAGEVGHIPIDADGEMKCGCGNYGHWEAYCSGDNIPQYARHLYDGQETSLPIGQPSFDATDVFAYADTDEFAATVVDRLIEWNAQGVASVVHAYAPIVVYIGGAVALNNPWLIDRLEARIPELVISNIPEINLTSFGDEVVVNGALASAITGGTGRQG